MSTAHRTHSLHHCQMLPYGRHFNFRRVELQKTRREKNSQIRRAANVSGKCLASRAACCHLQKNPFGNPFEGRVKSPQKKSSRTVNDAVDRQPHRQQPGFHRSRPEAHLGEEEKIKVALEHLRAAQERQANFEEELAEGEKAKADLEKEAPVPSPISGSATPEVLRLQAKLLATEAEMNALNASQKR